MSTNAFKHFGGKTELERAKERSKLAFIAYQTALSDGDIELAEAASQRFLKESRELSLFRRKAHHGK